MLEELFKLITSRPVKIFSTAVVALLGIYGSFIYEKKPQITFELTSNATVLDVREKLSKLTVIYDGTNLKEQNQNLFILNIRISNKGNADILKSNFDEGEPLGFKINSGFILEPPQIIGDEYLKNNLNPKILDKNIVAFSPVILNADDAFEVKVLILVMNGAFPTITPIGKIAGVKNLQLSEPYKEATNDNIFYEAFYGGWKLQLIRIISYFVIAVILVIVTGVLIFLPVKFISEKIQRQRRIKRVDKYRLLIKRLLSLEEEFLVRNYINKSKVYELFEHLIDSKNPKMNFQGVFIELNKEYLFGDDIERFYEELENAGLIIRDGPQAVINPAIEKHAKEFVSFVSQYSKENRE